MRKKGNMKWAARVMALCLMGASVFAGANVATEVTAEADTIIDNTRTTGTLTIKKNGEQEDSPLGGATFSVYKVMSLTPGTNPGDYAAYEKVDAFESALAGVNPDELGNYSAASLQNLIDELVKASADTAATATGTTSDGTSGTKGEFTFSNLDLGYYLVVETQAPEGYVAGSPFLIAIPSTDNYNSAGAGTSWVYDVTAEPKNKPVSIDKELAGPTEGAEQDGTVAVGDFVKYKVTSAIPNYPDEYFADGLNVYFTIYDEMSDGLEIQNDPTYPVTVKVNNAEVPNGETTFNLTAASVKGDGKDLTIAFVKEYIKEHRGESVEVTYFAKVTEDAVTGTAGNKNTVTLDYNNKPGEKDEAGPAEETVYSFNIKVEKFTKDETPQKGLDGAEFGLYSDAGCTAQVAKAVTAGGGNLTFGKLDAGTYYLKELKSPAGYTLLTNPIKVEIRATTGGGFELYVDDNQITTEGGSFVTRLEPASGSAIVAVENHKGFSLPATGGAGIAFFLIVGAAGIITVSVVIIKKTKKSR